MSERFYTGIGSRKTPKDVQDKMADLAVYLAKLGYTLRSGGADGADTAFEAGCDIHNGKKEIYLPWKGFNDNPSDIYSISPVAYEIAEQVYGYKWKHLKEPVRKLMSRNIHQVAGKRLDEPSELVICWTPDGCTTGWGRTRLTGGTGQAIEYADTLSVPIFNLYNENDLTKITKYIDTLGALEW
jgi:hypothetical protein